MSSLDDCSSIDAQMQSSSAEDESVSEEASSPVDFSAEEQPPQLSSPVHNHSHNASSNEQPASPPRIVNDSYELPWEDQHASCEYDDPPLVAPAESVSISSTEEPAVITATATRASSTSPYSIPTQFMEEDPPSEQDMRQPMPVHSEESLLEDDDDDSSINDERLASSTLENDIPTVMSPHTIDENDDNDDNEKLPVNQYNVLMSAAECVNDSVDPEPDLPDSSSEDEEEMKPKVLLSDDSFGLRKVSSEGESAPTEERVLVKTPSDLPSLFQNDDETVTPPASPTPSSVFTSSPSQSDYDQHLISKSPLASLGKSSAENDAPLVLPSSPMKRQYTSLPDEDLAPKRRRKCFWILFILLLFITVIIVAIAVPFTLSQPSNKDDDKAVPGKQPTSPSEIFQTISSVPSLVAKAVVQVQMQSSMTLDVEIPSDPSNRTAFVDVIGSSVEQLIGNGSDVTVTLPDVQSERRMLQENRVDFEVSWVESCAVKSCDLNAEQFLRNIQEYLNEETLTATINEVAEAKNVEALKAATVLEYSQLDQKVAVIRDSPSPTTSPPTGGTGIMPVIFPTIAPSPVPSMKPSENPTMVPFASPVYIVYTFSPTTIPTSDPTETYEPSPGPTVSPTVTRNPSLSLFPSTSPPSFVPSVGPSSNFPSATPTGIPTTAPSIFTTLHPTESPQPSPGPTNAPTTSASPTLYPTETTKPTPSPSNTPSQPTPYPSLSITPTLSLFPSIAPTGRPTASSSPSVSYAPSESPEPSPAPSISPTSWKKAKAGKERNLKQSGRRRYKG